MLQRLNSGSATIPQQTTVSAFAEFVEHLNRRQRRQCAARKKKNRSSRRQFENGQRCAVIRALTAARLYLDGSIPTLRMAAISCGDTIAYVRAAIVLWRAEDSSLRTAVLNGSMSLLAAAKEAKPRADLMTAYRAANGTAKSAFARIITPEKLWNETIAPVLDNTETSKPAPTMEDDITIGDLVEAAYAS